MPRDLNWKTLEDRRTISRLTLLYKSVHNIVAINIVGHYTNHEKRNIKAIKTSSISFTHPTARKNCHRYSFTSRTVAEWNRLPATIRDLLTLQRLDCAVLSFLLIIPDTKLLNHVRWPPHTCPCNRLSRMWRSDCSTRQKQTCAFIVRLESYCITGLKLRRLIKKLTSILLYICTCNNKYQTYSLT